jgi:radical SAM-linked protein
MRLRITFSKSGALRYIGHLDLHSIWERTIRRAGLPLAYTHGFHPGPRMQVASALPLGFIGRAEILDIWLDESALADPQVSQYADRLQAAAPPGLVIKSIETVDKRGPALQTQVTSAEYEVTLLDQVDEEALAREVSAILAAASLQRERRSKPYDLRPLIESLAIKMGDEHKVMIFIRLAAREGATGRPEEVLDILGIPPESTCIERARLVLKVDIK